MKYYVGRYDNGTGYMKFLGSPTTSKEDAKEQVKRLTWSTYTDVVEVRHNGTQWVEV